MGTLDVEGSGRPAPRAVLLISGIALVAALSLARDFLIPAAVAGLLACALAPLAGRLERWGTPRVVAAVLATLLAATAMAALAGTVARQAVVLSRSVPEYRERIRAKLRLVSDVARSSPLSGARDVLEGLAAEPPAAEPGKGGEAPPGAEPVAVAIVEAPPSDLEAAGELVGGLLGPLGAAFVILLLTGFLLAGRAELKDRFVRLLSVGRLVATTEAIEDAVTRVTRYLGGMLALNALYALLVAAGLHLLGLPNAALWGLLAGLLRFIPYVGTWIGAAFPVALSIAVFDGLGSTFAVFGVLLALDLLVGGLLEPVVFGRRTGLTPLVVVLSTLFWTWLWGIPGVVLAVPLTVCAAVLGRHVAGLRFLDVLLGATSPLSVGDRVYQALLLLDADGARRLVTAAGARGSLAACFDEVLLPVLLLAKADRERGVLDEGRAAAILAAVDSLADDLAEAASVPPDDPGAGRPVLVPAGRGADAVACRLVAHLLAQQGIAAEVRGAGLSGEVIADLGSLGARSVCVAGLPPFLLGRLRLLCRSIRERLPGTRLLAAYLDDVPDRADVEGVLRRAGADAVGFRPSDVADRIAADAREASTADARVAQPSRA